ncbi:hypothetical protein ABB37_05205 [Leptomonas pyrrhocoris]|uniref:F-box domain-containing protein n=1 Tax=Leptomonas pyrrhocoris TaxID=157538 RepID=A0A0M9G160_LEPPY|nr:hypothetical protein ABB37_05205 [Leptomonas pyrrhocoris]KPA80235.1 hypothetical protein ABB37_05205 [Leptomonas pyrrhocoris]|eukprot:XP_015658674.1 hypothetical protein ABB37_05205 [Leptomonas pyrrhocoris]
MPHTAVMSTAKPLFEPESLREQQQQGTRSPCTPPLQSIKHSKRESPEEYNGKRNDILDWSPPTPESLPVMHVRDVVNGAPADNEEEVDDENAVVMVADVLERKLEGNAKGDSGGNERQPAEECKGEDASAPVQSTSPAATTPLVSAPPTHVDPVDEPGNVGRCFLAPINSNYAVDTCTSTEGLDRLQHHGVFFPDEVAAATTAALFVFIASYGDLPTLVQLMRVCRASHQLATCDEVWKPILCDMNLPPLLAAYDRSADYYAFFLDEIVTTRALHGHYTFQAANNATGSYGSVSNASGSRAGADANRDHLRDDDSLQEDVFNIASLQLLISAASLGQSNHLIGRVQLLLTYKNDSMEVLQGSCRFSVFRRCFSLCCSAFGTVKRGPVFTVAVATVTKPWANEGFQHFSEHKNGIRLVMTPVLWEGQSPGSQITEKDILVVSRPRPEPAAGTANAPPSEPSTQSRC